MKKLTKILFLIFIFLAFVFLLLWNSRPKSDKSISLDNNERFFYQKLEEFNNSGKKNIELKELVNFEWKVACLILPYSGIESDEFRKFKLNKNLPGDEDGKSTIVFFDDKNLTGNVIIIYRTKYEINYDTNSRSKRDQCFSKNKALLKTSDISNNFLLTKSY